MLIFVILTGVGIQLCSIQIDGYNSKLLTKISTINIVENVRISQKLSSVRYLLAALADANVEVGYEEAFNDKSLHPDYKRIVEQYKSGQITKREYFNQLSVRHNRDSVDRHRDYLRLMSERDEFIKEKPIWIKVRSVLFILQLLSIVICIGTYYWMYQSIRKRIK